jgi:tRNA-2-methylthio-N6-dimethylallyladenosine synthase
LENSEIQATKNSDLGKGRGVFISTYGCQMNVNDTERMYSLLEMSNFTPVSSADQAELIIINSCSVREKPVHKVYSEVGTYKKLKDKNPNLKIGVGGCVGSQEKQSLIADAPLIDFVFGTDNIDTLPQLVNKTLSGVAKTAKERKLNLVDTNFRHREPYHIETLVRNPGVATFVNITKGCDNFCTFCVVPYTRGREKSRPAEHIISDIHSLVKRGVKEVTLLGQNVNSYESECGVDFGALVERVAKETDIQRIRFTTSHPKDFDQRLVEILYRNQPKVCEYIHLPFQSGNSRILELMNRGYTREQYLEKLKMIKRAMPNVVLSTDIIVGFPGETEEEFQDTLSMVEEVGFETIYAFMYSSRPMTKAAKMDGHLSEEVKSERLNRLFDHHDKLAFEWVKRYEGQVLDVLFESYDPERKNLMGRSSQNKVIHVAGPKSLVGETRAVKVLKAFPANLRGELVTEAVPHA